jgi:thiol-disulfide isomerase/thioredoxin
MRGAVLVLSIVIAAGSIGRAGERTASAIETMRLVDLDGREWTAARLRGRVTLIDFWATWCAPCLTELPYVKQARARYGRHEFEVLGVSFDVSDRRTLVSWLNRHAVEWPQVFDGRGRTGPAARHFGVSAVPTSFLIGADGALVAMNLRGERLLAAIDEGVNELRRRRVR